MQKRRQVSLLIIVEIPQQLIIAEIHRGDFLCPGIYLAAGHTLHTVLVYVELLVDFLKTSSCIFDQPILCTALLVVHRVLEAAAAVGGFDVPHTAAPEVVQV